MFPINLPVMARSLILVSSLSISVSWTSGNSLPMAGVTSNDFYSSRDPLYFKGSRMADCLDVLSFACTGTVVVARLVSTSAAGGAMALISRMILRARAVSRQGHD